MNVVILMAGSNENKLSAYPKNLVEINGQPLLQNVIEGLSSLKNGSRNFIIMLKKDENDRFYTKNVAKLVLPKAKIVEVPSKTKGAACTALLSIEYINNNEPLLIINGDIIIKEDINCIINKFIQEDVDGGIITFNSVHPRWSYVKCNSDDLIVEVAEKKPISNMATAGVYYFKKGKYFVDNAMNMIRKENVVNDKFYVSLVYNEMILNQYKLKTFEIERKKYFSLSTDEDIKRYEAYCQEKHE